MYMFGGCVCISRGCIVHAWGGVYMPGGCAFMSGGCVYASGGFSVGRKSHILHTSNVGLCLDQSWSLDTAILSCFLCSQLLPHPGHKLSWPGTCLYSRGSSEGALS